MIAHENFRRNLTAEEVAGILEEKLSTLRRSPDEVILTDKQVCRLLGVSPRLTAIWRAELKIGHSKIGQKIFYTLEDVLKMVEKHKVASADSSLRIKI